MDGMVQVKGKVIIGHCCGGSRVEEGSIGMGVVPMARARAGSSRAGLLVAASMSTLWDGAVLIHCSGQRTGGGGLGKRTGGAAGSGMARAGVWILGTGGTGLAGLGTSELAQDLDLWG